MLLLSVFFGAGAGASPLTQTSPAPFNIDLSGLLPNHGGTYVLVIGQNGNYLASSIPRNQLFEGYMSTGEGNALGQQIGSVQQSDCDEDIGAFFNGGIANVYVRMTLDDGDTAQGDFDYNENFLALGSGNNFDFANEQNYSTVATERTRNNASRTGFPDGENVTGWFNFSDVSSTVKTSYLSSGEIQLYHVKKDTSTQYYSWAEGAPVGLDCTVGEISADLQLIVKITNDNTGSKSLVDFNVGTSASTPVWSGGVTSGSTTTWTSDVMPILPATHSLTASDLASYVEADWSCQYNGNAAVNAGSATAGSITADEADVIVCTLEINDIPPVSDLSIDKSAVGGGTYTPGGTGSYRLVVTNNGPDDVVAAFVSDPLPGGVSLNGSWSCDPSVAPGDGSASCVSGGAPGTGLVNSGPITLTVDIPNGKSLVVTIPVSFDADADTY